MAFFRTLAAKTIITNCVVVIMCMSGLLWVTQSLVAQSLEKKFEVEVTVFTHFLAEQINTGTRLKREAMIAPQLESAITTEGLPIAAIRVTHTDNSEIANTFADGVTPATAPGMQPANFERPANFYRVGGFKISRAPIMLGSGADQVTVGEISVTWDRAPLNNSVRALVNKLAIAVAVVTGIVALATFLMIQGFVARPLRKIVSAFEHISDREAKIDLPQSSSVEIKALTASFENFQRATHDTEDLLTEMGPVLSAAQAGDFSIKLDTSGGMSDFRVAVNGLLETVDNGLSDTTKLMSRLSDFDLTAEMDGEFHGAFAELQRDANTMTRELRQVVSTIEKAALQVKSQADDIAQSASGLSERSQRNAAALEEVTASVQTVTSELNTSRDAMNTAERESSIAIERAENGQKIVQRVVESINDIHRFSKDIANIVSLIDDVAFQTNLLALNAGVEAARAGEAGKGFAVVASEVRSLAQSASRSASEIKELISGSTSAVERGVEQVDVAGKSISAIVESITEMSSMIQSVASSGVQQTASLTEINVALNSIDQATQSNAAEVEASLTNAQDLKAASNTMLQGVSTFRTEAAASTPKLEATG